MKNYSILTVLAATALFGACSNFDEPTPGTGTKDTRVSFLADIAPREQTRADINVDFESGLSGTWNNVDILGVVAQAPAQSYSNLLQFTFSETNKAFEGSMPGAKGDWQYLAFYPHNGNATVSGTTATVPFGAQRTQAGNKYNSEFDLLAADAVNCTNSDPGKTPEGEAVKFNLNRFTSILALKLQGGSASEKIASIMLTSKKSIASDQLTFTIPTGTYDPSALNPTLVVEGTSETGAAITLDSKHITVTYTGDTAPAANYSETFFNLLPDDNYGELTFSICTDQGNAASVTVNRTTPLVANWVYTKEADLTFAKASVPTIVWVGKDLSERYELADNGNSANIEVSVPGGIHSMQVDITAPMLTTPDPDSGQSLLEAVGLAASMDLTNPATEQMAGMLATLGFPTPAQLKNQQFAYFQIGGLIDLLAMVCASSPATSESDFKFTVIDNAGQTQIVTLQYVKTIGPAIRYKKDANLWANTASFNLVNIPAEATSVSVSYKKSTETAWQTATVNAERTLATAAPEWEDKTAADWSTPNSADVQPYSRIKAGSGIFAGSTYDYKLTVDGVDYTGQFTTGAGNTIPNGDLETWKNDKQFPGKDGNLFGNPFTYDFLGCGYNSFAKELCVRDGSKAGRGGSYCAKLNASYNGTASIPAPGNLFTGDFKVSMSPMGGYVFFGKKCTYNARPTAIKFKYHATIGAVDYNLYGGKLAVGETDKSRVMVCIVDWSAQQQVLAGKTNPSGMWDPEKQTSAANGAIIGYASKFIEESTTGEEMVEVTVPINYYQKTDAAPAGNFNIVISCSTSAFGDYMNACTTNVLYLDDFQWVY